MGQEHGGLLRKFLRIIWGKIHFQSKEHYEEIYFSSDGTKSDRQTGKGLRIVGFSTVVP
jgi:hypothetical protein